MNNQILSTLLLVCLLAVVVVGPIQAEIGKLDTVPAATLLLPYFEVDLNGGQTSTTLLTIANARESPALLNIVLWTDWGVPTLGIPAYLTGFDVMEINLLDLFASGMIPQTSHTNTTISPVGSFSLVTSPETGVGPGTVSCHPLIPLPPLPFIHLDHIRAAHRGLASSIFGGACSGSNQGDNVARGYITIDNTNTCSLRFPGEFGYFVNGGNGDANNVNALLGSYRILEDSGNLVHGGAMVHLEASSTDPRTAPGSYTFYAKFSGGADNREPLSSALATPFVSGMTDLIYWRDTKLVQSPVSCGTLPLPFPMSLSQITFFDQEENPEVPETSPFSPPLNPFAAIPFRFAAGRVTVGSAEMPTLHDRGWLYTDLVNDHGSALLDPNAQAWIGVVDRDPSGFLTTSQPAWEIYNTSEEQDILLPCLNGFPPPLCGNPTRIFGDGFESGDLLGWSLVVP